MWREYRLSGLDLCTGEETRLSKFPPVSADRVKDSFVLTIRTEPKRLRRKQQNARYKIAQINGIVL